MLLLQRTDEPFKHCWNLPAGYVEADESPTQTVAREVYEETGLQVEVGGLGAWGDGGAAEGGGADAAGGGGAAAGGAVQDERGDCR